MVHKLLISVEGTIHLQFTDTNTMQTSSGPATYSTMCLPRLQSTWAGSMAHGLRIGLYVLDASLCYSSIAGYLDYQSMLWMISEFSMTATGAPLLATWIQYVWPLEYCQRESRGGVYMFPYGSRWMTNRSRFTNDIQSYRRDTNFMLILWMPFW